MTSIRFTADDAGRSSFVIAIRNGAGWLILARIRHFRQHDAINRQLINAAKQQKRVPAGEIRLIANRGLMRMGA